MTSNLLNLLKSAVLYCKNHPQIFFIFSLLIFLPYLFLYTGQQFLDAGRENQDRLQKDKVGLMHDTFASLLYGTNFNIDIAKQELDKITVQNPDIVDYKISIQKGGHISPLVAKDPAQIDKIQKDENLYINSSLRTDESLIFEFTENSVRTWSAYRAIKAPDNQIYFLYTKISLGEIDNLFTSREHKAYYSLFFVYLFVIVLAYWHIKLTDYRYLYLESKKASELKDLFTNMITHELRTPLTAIVGYASLLDEKITDPQEKVQVNRIEESGKNLLETVNDLLDVARIQSGKLAFKKASVDITTTVKEVLSQLEIIASTKNITLTSEGTEVEHILQTDEKRLHQVLTNLITNAIKYTPQGEIAVSINDIHTGLEIRVKDTGMGISADDQQKLFAPFFRVESTDVSKITGTGLGMWITKELVDLMGAKIGVESIKGVGTHVVIVFPKLIKIS